MTRLLALFVALVLIGCAHRKAIDATTLILESRSATEAIRHEAQEIQKIAPQATPHAQVIEEQAERIDQSTTQTEKAIAALQEELKREKEGHLKAYRRWLVTIAIAAGLAASVSVALFVLGNLKSLTMTIVALSVLFGAIALQVMLSYLVWIAVGVGLLVLLIVGYAAFVNRRAIREMFGTVESLKPKVDWNEAKSEIRQSGATKNMVDRLQLDKAARLHVERGVYARTRREIDA